MSEEIAKARSKTVLSLKWRIFQDKTVYEREYWWSSEGHFYSGIRGVNSKVEIKFKGGDKEFCGECDVRITLGKKMEVQAKV